MKFYVHVKYMNKPNIIFNKTVTNLSLFWQNIIFHIWTLQATFTLEEISNIWFAL